MPQFLWSTILAVSLVLHSISEIKAQAPPQNNSFPQIDAFARSVKYRDDLYRLTKELTEPYPDQLSKIRSIFIWITDNIAYDYNFINKGKEIKLPECKVYEDCDRIYREWEMKYLKKVIKKGKGICDGYARLFQKMCEIAGIKSEIVAGYTKTKPYHIGATGSLNHAWNAVWIDSAYYLLDPTWAAGYCIENEDSGLLEGFVKSYENYYWFTPFNDLARDHYPKEGKWVLEANYTKEKYAANPYIASGIIPRIHLLSPHTGILEAKVGDTIHFEFDFKGALQCLQLNSNVARSPSLWYTEKISRRREKRVFDANRLKRQVYIDFIQKGATNYSFDYIVSDKSLYYLEILFNYQKVMRFKVIVK